MKIISNVDELSVEIKAFKEQGRKIGFVPTMGALHRGHQSLVEQSVAANEVTVVSIFVNPTQFNNAFDLEKYPRTLDRDARLLHQVGCDLIFAPSVSDIYTEEDLNKSFEFDFGGLDTVMEGRFRPGHFNGVVQIVSRLFDLVQPDQAYFGEKDFQQLSIIHRMVKLMGYKVNIVDCPIVREESGLAMSSRNERLSQEELCVASGISKVLFESKAMTGQCTPIELTEWVVKKINEIQGLTVEYFEIVDVSSLQKVDDWKSPAVGCIAVFCAEVRLIDNIRY